MTKYEELAEKKAALEALAPQIEADDEDAISQGTELKAAIETIETDIQKAEAKAAVLEMVGNSKSTDMEDTKMTELELFCKNAGEVDRNRKGWSVGTHIKAATDVVTGVEITDYDKQVAPQPDRVAAKSLFTQATISGNAITYFLQGAYEGAPAVVAEGAKKPQNSTSFEPVTLPLSKIAAYIKETDEIVNDAPFLASEVRNALLYQLGVVEDAGVIGAVANTSGILGGTYGAGSGSIATTFVDGILYAAREIKAKSAYDATVIILNPADMFALLTDKDQNHQYIGGGYFFGAYGNGAYKTPNTLWGIPVFESNEITAGQALVCAKQAVNVWQKGGVDVKLYEQNEDDAIYNRVTLLAEERIAVGVKDLRGVYLLEEE